MIEFPLFRVNPSILFEVFRSFDTIDLFTMSFCSGKCFKHAQEVLRKVSKDFTMTISLGAELSISTSETYGFFRNTTSIRCENLVESTVCVARLHSGELNGVPHMESKSCKFSDHKWDYTMTMFWENKHQGMQMMIGHFLRLYHDSTYHLKLDIGYIHLIESLDVLNTLINKSPRIKKNAVISSGIRAGSHHPLTMVLDRLMFFSRLSISIIPDDDFIRNDMRMYQKVILHIRQGSWITLNHLLRMNCAILSVFRSSLSSQDLNLYLKEWIKGACRRMRCFDVEMSEINFDIILENIPFVENDKVFNLQGTKVNLSFDITNENGKLAKLRANLPVDPQDTEIYKLFMEVSE